MTCAVISDHINIVLNAGTDRAAPRAGSAHQQPDVSRAQLGALLRRQDSRAARRAGRTFWSAFIAFQATQIANSNG